MLVLSCLLLALATSIDGAVVNTEVTRIIDASSAVVREVMGIKATGLSGVYQVVYPDAWAKRIAFIEVTDKEDKSGNSVYDVAAPVTDGAYTTYEVKTGSKTSVSLKVTAVFTELLKPYPAEITQLEDQRVELSGNHYISSPYHTGSQKTTVKLASSKIESYSRLEPNSQSSSSVVYGPYKEIPAFANSPMKVHYVNNKPFAKFTQAEREIEVSHWGNIAVEETYELRNVGAKLKGGFSRLDYQMQRGADSPSFAKLTAFLPREARDIYYRDQIGNISTSDITPTDEDLQMDVGTRFPLFGGWKTEFYIGYSVPASLALFMDENDRYSLNFDFFTIFQDVWIQDMEIKVVLPEGASEIDVQLPYEVSERVDTRRFTYFDSTVNGGRPVITIRAHNVVENHSDQVTISYNFTKSRMLVEPLMLIGTFFAIFICITIVNAANRPSKKNKRD